MRVTPSTIYLMITFLYIFVHRHNKQSSVGSLLHGRDRRVWTWCPSRVHGNEQWCGRAHHDIPSGDAQFFEEFSAITIYDRQISSRNKGHQELLLKFGHVSGAIAIILRRQSHVSTLSLSRQASMDEVSATIAAIVI